jgi:hypothetical protein
MPSGLVKKTKEGSNHRSTSEETLTAIKEEMISRDGKAHPIIDVILEFRSFNKMLTSFVQPLPKFSYKVHDSDDYPKIHPQWMQTVRNTIPISEVNFRSDDSRHYSLSEQADFHAGSQIFSRYVAIRYYSIQSFHAQLILFSVR